MKVVVAHPGTRARSSHDLDRSGMRGLVDAVVTAQSCTLESRPYGRLFTEAMMRLDGTLDEVLVVTDNMHHAMVSRR